ncbi:DUF2169 family type VI secretion system accessory protein [Spiribacter halobius]|uniref:DUF2169 domain-containing protein n=1 Tax=Sediminicurvatus halobius TaxID=2182432 RepID=A0A2U2N1Z5_9GAMM|nr:DUF2169 domain-containing protein [Spiribacter halobius]PWG63255.1 hypothetical protein DEM34_09270 [Spiribacter halobius]UEX76673.1 DUF2169 domain-containing protein [Spiribacter halobius]
MDLEDFSGFTVASVVSGQARGQGYRLTVLVKAGFALRPDGRVEPLEGQPLLEGDRPLLQGWADHTALEHPSDAVPWKPRADVLLRGTAHAPRTGRPRPAMRVGIRVGELAKTLAVFGPRRFRGGLLGTSISEPEPVNEVALTYENAYGGEGDPRNPVGKGRNGDELPNIEYLDQLIQGRGDRPDPAGFGPLSPNWEPRRGMVGSYGGDYLERRWPGFPDDFDWSYFNAAPRDQQVDGYLRGDEAVSLEGLHPDHGLIRTQLPGIRVVCIREDHDGRVERLPMNLDTLWIDADAGEIHLVWRGVTAVETFEAMEIRRLGILDERLEAPVRQASEYRQQLQALIDARDTEFEEELPAVEDTAADEPARSADTGAAPAAEPVEAEDPFPPELAEQLEALRQPQEAAEAAPAEAPALSPEVEAEAQRILGEIEAREKAEAEEQQAEEWTRERVIAAAAEGESLAGADLGGLDLSRHRFGAADFRGARLGGTDFTGSELTGACFRDCLMDGARLDGGLLARADLGGAQLDGASLLHADLSGAVLQAARLSGATLDDADLTAADCALATFARASLVGASLARARLAEADLSTARLDRARLGGCQAGKAVLAGAFLGDADLRGADLQEATLAEASLPHAQLENANLAGADLASAFLRDAVLREAILTGADFGGADLRGAILERVSAADADFTGARMEGCSFRAAMLSGAWLSSAALDGADFQGSDCTDLQLDGTSLRRARFPDADITTLRGSAGADFSDADFRGSHGREAVFEGCVLDGADFSCADLEGANFIHCSAVDADFTAADMPFARFTLARCRGARFDSANLFEGSLEGADLTGAYINGANFYGVELLDATLKAAEAEGTNLLMTKLGP